MPRERLCQQLGYTFRNQDLLTQALTHRSAGTPHNERLEFLGDAVLNLVIAEELYRLFPRTREGQLTRLRASQVKGETLSKVARGLALGKVLLLGSGELKSGGRNRDSILADALEAVLGAVYLDAGFEVCRRVVLEIYQSRLQAIEPYAGDKDPKTRLQEWLQARRHSLPAYQVVRVEGQAHEQHFTVACEIQEPPVSSTGTGSSRRRAEQAAADDALATLFHMNIH